MIFRPLICLVGLLLLAGCDREPASARHAFFALGTLVEITVFNPPPNLDEVLRETEAALLAEDKRWQAWGDGHLAELNRQLTKGETVTVPAKISAAVRRAREIAVLSGHRFNPAMGRLVEAWGFHREERSPQPPPADATLSTFLPAPKITALVRNADRWNSTDSRLWLDMGAFAKGLAVETAIEMLRKNGIENAIVNAGGDLKAIGRHGVRAWRVGVRHPRDKGVLAAIDVDGNESVFTSGDYERFFDWEGERFHHILDPRTGFPARGVTSVTVIHPDAALADAAATALFVAGESEWPAVARSMQIDTVMMVLADGSIQLTPSMQGRADFEVPVETIEVVVP